MQPGGPAVLAYFKEDHHLSNGPGKTRMFPHPDGRSRWIICFRNRHCSGVPSNVDYFTIRIPFQQLWYMADINRELDASPAVAAELGDFLDEGPENRAQTSIRLLDFPADLPS